MDPASQVGLQARQLQASADQREQGVGQLRDTAEELEGVFLGLLMKAMRTTVGNGGLFKNGTDAQTYRDMFDQEIARNMARAGGIGLAQMILRDQLHRQALPESTGPEKTAQVLPPADR